MPKYHIQILDTDTNQTDRVDTDGVVLLYLEQGKVRITGKVELSELAPFLVKLVMEKLVK